MFLYDYHSRGSKRGREGDQENPLTQGPLFPQEHNFSHVLSGVDDWDIDDTKQCVTSLGLQVQSVVARVVFPHEDNSRLISNSQETVEKTLFVLVGQPAKQSSCLASPTPPSGYEAQDVECK
jgi:hypothetical protein